MRDGKKHIEKLFTAPLTVEEDIYVLAYTYESKSILAFHLTAVEKDGETEFFITDPRDGQILQVDDITELDTKSVHFGNNRLFRFLTKKSDKFDVRAISGVISTYENGNYKMIA